MHNSAITLLPPFIAIIIAIWRKNALLALLCGLILSHAMLMEGHIIKSATSAISGVFGVFLSSSNIYIVGFSLFIGALVSLLNTSGAVNGFIEQLTSNNLVKNRRHAHLLPTIIGTSIFTDTNLSMFTAGMASQKLFDQHQLSRARLAYLIDSTCAPVSILFLVNGWGAYILGLLDGYAFEDTVGILISTIAYNVYAIIALVMAYFTAITGKVYGAMKYSIVLPNDQYQERCEQMAPAWFMWLTMLFMLTATFVLLYITGSGDIRHGSGAFSVFWSVLSALVLLMLLLYVTKSMDFRAIMLSTIKGIKTMLPAISILVLSFAFGDVVKALGTGNYVSQLIFADVVPFLTAPVLFLAASIMAFATGTSWGTFAILIPIAIPIALQTGLPVEFLVAAVLGGGVFGDHASPISDTTVVAAIASGCDHFEHVRTQLPYALVGALITIIVYVFIGLSF